MYETAIGLFQEALNILHITLVSSKLQYNLTFTTLWAFSADDKMMLFFLFFPENRIWHFMQIVSLGDNLHEMSNPVFWEK